AGVTVWVRARGEALGRRPSQYTTPVSIAIPSTPRVHGVRVGVVDGVATVAWTPNARTRGVRVFYAAHAPDVEPALIDSLDVAAAEGSVVLPIRIAVGQSVTVEVEPWTGWTGSAVTGTRGSRVRAAATYDRGAPAISPVLDGDNGRLYLHPYRNEFCSSVRYVVSPLDIPTLEEVREGTVSSADRILVHTFVDNGQEQRVYVAVLPFRSADGTGAEGSMVV